MDLAKLREIATKATPGPWRWFGDVETKQVELATTYGGRIYVMTFARWGMGGAQPCFQIREPGQDVRHGFMATLAEMFVKGLVTKEVPYRGDIASIDHPDARFMETFNPKVALELLDHIRELESHSCLQPMDTHDGRMPTM